MEHKEKKKKNVKKVDQYEEHTDQYEEHTENIDVMYSVSRSER